MSISDSYFQFPVKALRTRRPIAEIDDDPELRHKAFSRVKGYCLIKFAKAVQIGDNGYGDDLDRSDWMQCLQRAAYHLLFIRDNHNRAGQAETYSERFEVTPEQADQWQSDYDKIEALGGGLTLVRMRKDIFLDFKKSRTWREFAILAAVYAGIGNQSFRIVRQSRLEFLAAGYSGDFEAREAGYCPTGLSRRQIQTTVNHLQEQRFFAKAMPNRRDCYFSNSMSLVDLAEALVAKRQRKIDDRAVTQMIQSGDLSPLKKTKPNPKRSKSQKSSLPDWGDVV